MTSLSLIRSPFCDKMHILASLTALVLLSMPGCAGNIMPISNGSVSDLPEPSSSAVVWGQHKGSVGETVTLLQQMGVRIVERSRLQQVFDEQNIRLVHSTDDEAQLLRVGKILGAGSIIFVDVEATSSQVARAFVNQYGGGSRTETVTNASVSARGVNIETGEVMWTGTAHYPQPINNPEAGIIYLSRLAVLRGLCPAGAWKGDNEGQGCDYGKAFGTGMIGFNYERKETVEGKPLVIKTVQPDSPADKAGLKVGDELVSCNGKSGFQTIMQFRMACNVASGQLVNLQVRREGKLTSISAIAISRTQLAE